MINQELHTYITQQLAQGETKEIIIAALLSTGWQKPQIDEIFSIIPQAPTIAPQGTNGLNPQKPITEKDYPVQFVWIFKSISYLLIVTFIAVIAFILGNVSSNTLLIPLTVIYFVVAMLRRKSFHYAIAEKFVVIQQGILSKQQRNIPYGVIQNVYVKQDIFDRVFGLASVALENASQGGGSRLFGKILSSRNQGEEIVGSKGNRITIPGLKKQNAETVKAIILQKMKENPLEDNQSGL